MNVSTTRNKLILKSLHQIIKLKLSSLPSNKIFANFIGIQEKITTRHNIQLLIGK